MTSVRAYSACVGLYIAFLICFIYPSSSTPDILRRILMRLINPLVGLCWIADSAFARSHATVPASGSVDVAIESTREDCGLCNTTILLAASNLTATVNGSVDGAIVSTSEVRGSVTRIGSSLAAFRDRMVALGHWIRDVVFPSSEGLLLIRRYFIPAFKVWLFTVTAVLISQFVYPLLLSYLRVDAPPAQDYAEPAQDYAEPAQDVGYSIHPKEPKWWRTSNMECPFEVLGVALMASQAEIRRAYRTLSIQAHPDKHLEDKTAYTVMFRIIAEAYERLNDPSFTRYCEEACGI